MSISPVKRLLVLVGTLALSVALALPTGGPAGAVDGTEPVTTLVIQGTNLEQAQSTLTMGFDQPVTYTEAIDYASQIAPDAFNPTLAGTTLTESNLSTDQSDATPSGASFSSTATASAAGPSGTSLRCNRAYVWGDAQGSFTLQRACGGSTAPWGWSMNPNLRPWIVGEVAEDGMRWSRNGKTMPMMSPHSYPPSAVFHGTFNPARAGDYLTYSDTFRFRHRIASGGNGIIHIYGSFTLTDTRPCGSGGPC
jgi:hypothetical protein